MLIISNTGLEVPQIGFGTWQAKPGEVEKAVAEALKVGYRHIDCALIYGNQNEVAQGIAEAGVPRSEIMLVSEYHDLLFSSCSRSVSAADLADSSGKLWNNSHRPENVEADLDVTLSQLKTDYLDAWLIHWPVAFRPGKELMPTENDERVIDWDAPSVAETWREMVRISKETKKVKAIGVSNFNIDLLKKIIDATGVVPAMNQIEAHPSLIQPELFAFCESISATVSLGLCRRIRYRFEPAAE